MADKQPSFGERIARMRDIASALAAMRDVLEGHQAFLFAEAARMAEAEQRFAKRRATRKADR